MNSAWHGSTGLGSAGISSADLGPVGLVSTGLGYPIGMGTDSAGWGAAEIGLVVLE